MKKVGEEERKEGRKVFLGSFQHGFVGEIKSVTTSRMGGHVDEDHAFA